MSKQISVQEKTAQRAKVLQNGIILELKHKRYKAESQSQPGKFYDVVTDRLSEVNLDW